MDNLKNLINARINNIEINIKEDCVNYKKTSSLLDNTNNLWGYNNLAKCKYDTESKTEINKIKKRIALIDELEKHNPTLPPTWRNLLDHIGHDSEGWQAGKIFREDNDLTGIDIKIARYYTRNLVPLQKITNLRINLTNSFISYASQLTASLELKRIETGSIDKSFRLLGLNHSNPKFLSDAYDYMIKKYPPVSFKELKLMPGRVMLMDIPFYLSHIQTKEERGFHDLIMKNLNPPIPKMKK